jgi:hypothetical protein
LRIPYLWNQDSGCVEFADFFKTGLCRGFEEFLRALDRVKANFGLRMHSVFSPVRSESVSGT